MSDILPSILIRFSDSADTLPEVLKALKKQTLQPDVILGINNDSQDGSCRLIEQAGGQVIEWIAPYEHSKVLNFGLRHLSTDFVLILSSHTVLEAPDTLARMMEAMRDPRCACVSGKWDADTYYSDHIDWKELRHKGLKFGSIYSNSMGMIRRRLWQTLLFSESHETAEDYAWAIEQIKRGFICKRLDFPFGYRRSGNSRDHLFAKITFKLARQYGLHVAWLGVKRSLRQWFISLLSNHDQARFHEGRLLAWFKAGKVRA